MNEELTKEIESLFSFLFLNKKAMINISLYSRGEDFKLRVNSQVYDLKTHKYKDFELPSSKIDLKYPKESINNIKKIKKEMMEALREN